MRGQRLHCSAHGSEQCRNESAVVFGRACFCALAISGRGSGAILQLLSRRWLRDARPAESSFSFCGRTGGLAAGAPETRAGDLAEGSRALGPATTHTQAKEIKATQAANMSETKKQLNKPARRTPRAPRRAFSPLGYPGCASPMISAPACRCRNRRRAMESDLAQRRHAGNEGSAAGGWLRGRWRRPMPPPVGDAAAGGRCGGEVAEGRGGKDA